MNKTYKIKKFITIKEMAENTLVLTEDQVKDIIEQYNKPTHKRKYFMPKVDDEYFVIDTWQTINNFINKDTDFYRKNIISGNCFETKQDAQDELNRRQALVRIWNNYDDNYAWDIVWNNTKKSKETIIYDYSKNNFYQGYSKWVDHHINTELPYFKSAEDRNQFVKDNEKDLLLIFGIK